MSWFIEKGVLTRERILELTRQAADEARRRICADPKRVLLLPPDITRAHSGAVRISMTVCRGFKLLNGSWKTIWTRSETRDVPAIPSLTLLPNRLYDPEAIGTRPTSDFTSVVFPQPDSPTILRILPCGNSNETSSTAVKKSFTFPKTPPRIGNLTERCCTSIAATELGIRLAFQACERILYAFFSRYENLPAFF